MRWVTGLAILGCWLGGLPGLLLGVLAGMLLDDALRGRA